MSPEPKEETKNRDFKWRIVGLLITKSECFSSLKKMLQTSKRQRKFSNRSHKKEAKFSINVKGCIYQSPSYIFISVYSYLTLNELSILSKSYSILIIK